MNDDLENLLTVSDRSPPQDHSVAAWAVLEQRRRVRSAMRSGVMVVMLVAAFVAGLSLRTPGQTVIEERMIVVPASDQSVATKIESEDPDRFEQRAELSDDRTQVALNYLLAGDAYLKRARFADAERCYRLHLRSAESTARLPSDTWLLANLKLAHTKGTS